MNVTSRSLLLVLALVTASNARGQSGWQSLANAPNTSGRHNDVYFVTQDRGWIVNGDGDVRKYYTATAEGRRVLAEVRGKIAELVEEVLRDETTKE